jgi:hypothetical protein
VNAPTVSNMAFFGNRPFFHRRPERGPATSAVDLRSASVPFVVSASHRYLPGSNRWGIVTLFGTIAALYFVFTVFMLIKRLDLRHRLFRLVGLGQINIIR